MNKLKVFFEEGQTAKSNSSFSPSATKPALVVNEWQKLYGDKIEIVGFRPLTNAEMSVAHNPAYIEGLMNLTIPNGFGNLSADVRDSLPYVNASVTNALEAAYHTGQSNFAPVSGAHHARYSNGGGFCTTNSLMVAAITLAKKQPIKIGIVDCDAHYYDGVVDIIKTLNIDYIEGYSLGGDHRSITGKKFLKGFKNMLINKFKDCDVLLYNAGADSHIDDPLSGNIAFTTEEMFERDLILFQTMKELGVPVTACLAGGYQKDISKVIECHANTMKAALVVEGMEDLKIQFELSKASKEPKTDAEFAEYAKNEIAEHIRWGYLPTEKTEDDWANLGRRIWNDDFEEQEPPEFTGQGPYGYS
jgi:acetoin utilization deacetylase AcuC-like enzyme